MSNPLSRPSLSTTANEWTPARLVMKPVADEIAPGPGYPYGAKATRWKKVALRNLLGRWRLRKSPWWQPPCARGGPIAEEPVHAVAAPLQRPVVLRADLDAHPPGRHVVNVRVHELVDGHLDHRALADE